MFMYQLTHFQIFIFSLQFFSQYKIINDPYYIV